jgi:hypothetical protein
LHCPSWSAPAPRFSPSPHPHRPERQVEQGDKPATLHHFIGS